MDLVVDMFFLTHTVPPTGAQLLAWPDGKSLMEQPNIWVEAVGVCKDELRKALEAGNG